MAGSEVYTDNLARELSKHTEISIFTRIENPFENSYTYFDENGGSIRIRRINKPNRDYSLKDKYLDETIDDAFLSYVKQVNPDIIHIDHLSHLSTNIVQIAKEEFDLPIIFTIHDFWLFCCRGQLIDPFKIICGGPSEENCFNCLKNLLRDISLEDIRDYQDHMRNVINQIDLFLSPSMFLKRFFENNGVPDSKIIYSPYGFNKDAIKYKNKQYDSSSKINFGFLGRIIPEKGIDILLKAFCSSLGGNSKLLIFGDNGSVRNYLDWYANANVVFKGGFDNRDINQVLQQIDVLVVPSIWYENSPLVIQEAFLAGIPVITSNIGGMAELVKDGINGLTFEVGNIDDLRNKIQHIQNNPTILNEIKPSRNDVRSIEEDALNIHSLYQELCKDETCTIQKVRRTLADNL